MERKVYKLLLEKKVVFERQKRFDWLGRQSLDFYLPEYNIAIECQGEQHFKPVDFGGKGEKVAIEEFNLTLKRDSLKKELCNKNGINILYLNNNNILNFIKNENF